jgi:hypothetical protein
MSAKLFSVVKRCEPKRTKGLTDRSVQTACLESQTIGFPRINWASPQDAGSEQRLSRKRVDEDSLAKCIGALQGTMFFGGELVSTSL